MPACGTFHYLGVVPEGGALGGPWQMESYERIVLTGSPLTDHRLVGWKPLLHIRDAGMTPNPGPSDAVRIGITGDHAFKGGFLIAQAIDVRTQKQKGWCQPGTRIER